MTWRAGCWHRRSLPRRPLLNLAWAREVDAWFGGRVLVTFAKQDAAKGKLERVRVPSSRRDEVNQRLRFLRQPTRIERQNVDA